MGNEMIRDQGIEFEPARFEAASAIYGQMRGPILKLRKVPLSFLEPVAEPAAALRWIENGGEE